MIALRRSTARALRFIALGLPVFLVACASAPPRLTTDSGRPEALVIGATCDGVMNHIVQRAASRGSTIRAATPYSVVVAAKTDSLAASLLFGSGFNSQPEGRTTITLVRDPRGCRMYASFEMVTNPGSGYEKSTDLTQSMAAQIQEKLEDVARTYRPIQPPR